MAGDFKTVQIRILIAVIEKLQNVIELSIQHLDKYCFPLQDYHDREMDIQTRELVLGEEQTSWIRL